MQYPKVRIAEGGVMTLFRTINLPAKGHHPRRHPKLLVHVKQFGKVGSVYLAQAVRAQKTERYTY